MKEERCAECHEGKGELLLHALINPGDSDHSLLFMHDDILPQGVSIGEHRHEGSEEVYFIVEGHGTLMMDRQSHPVGPGDVSLVKSGHSHGIVNTGETAMRLIVVGFRTT